MADVRSLLKSERASRRIAHPYARYSESGKLSCSLCDIFVKPESAWKSHIRTPDHVKRATKAAEAITQQTSKKRKADSDEGEDEDPRKRARGGDTDEDEEESASEDIQDKAPKRTVRFADGTKDPATPPVVSDAPAPTPSQPTVLDADLDDDPEWLELQRMASAPSQSTPYAGATISAAPMSAEEVAAQAREEESSQKERRQAEIEDENEDAAQALEAEFDEMDELEERVRKLREKREALRSGSGGDAAPLGAAPVLLEELGTVGVGEKDGERMDVDVEEIVDDDDEESADEDDVWNFGAE